MLDRAYAAISFGDHQVLHEVDVSGANRARGTYERIEGWLLPADGQARVIDISFGPFVSEWIMTATGRVFNRGCLSHCHPRSFIKGRRRWSATGGSVAAFYGPWGMLPGAYARMFQASYRDHALAPDGTATVDGKRVARFKSMGTPFGQTWIAWQTGARPPAKARNPRYIHLRIDWYVDPATARLIGLGVRDCTTDQIHSCEAHQPPLTIRIETFQRLDPTSENLAQLTGPHAPRGVR